MSIVQGVAEQIINNVGKVIIGKRNEIRSTVIGLLCDGHILIEDVPGVGKTMLARALSRSIGCTFSRIQFTPDMLPSDVTGVSVYNQKTMEFEFRPARLFPRSCWPTRSTGPRPRLRPRSWKRWKSTRSLSMERPTGWVRPFRFSLLRIRSSTKAPFPYPKRSSTAS